MIALGITGTDTGVGKTVVASAICALLRHQGYRVAPMKPIETGVGPREPGDAGMLLHASGSPLSLAAVSPLRYEEPLAPIVASERSGRPISVEVLDAAFHALTATHDAVVVEGAGGLLVPIQPSMRYDTLFARWGLGVIVVAANRLGAVNHTLLTVEAAARHVPVRGVVLNEVHPGPTSAAGDTNAALLTRLLGDTPVRCFPHLFGDRSPTLLVDHALRAGLGVFWEP